MKRLQTPSREFNQGGAIKRAISIPRALDEKVARVSREMKKPYSNVVQAALDLFIDRLSEIELEREYRRYYQRKDSHVADAALSTEMFAISKKSWPE